VQRFPGGLVFKAHRLVYHSTLGWRVIKKMQKAECVEEVCHFLNLFRVWGLGFGV